MPSIDLFAQRNESSFDTTQTNNGITGPADSDQTTDTIGVQVTIPIFSGGATRSRVREQVYLQRAERERLEGTMRAAERETRDAYLGVIAEKARVQALQQSVKSNQTALEATEAGFEVGTRTTVDVLDARRRLFEAQRDYARSRYDYLINTVRLKAAAGGLHGGRPRRDQRFPDAADDAAGGTPEDLSNGSTIATRRCTAPRFAATACRPLAPSLRARARDRRATSHTRCASSSPLRTICNAPLWHEQVGDILAVVRVRARHDRQAQHGRLEQAVAADRHETAAHERHIDGRVEHLQFAERVDQKYRRPQRREPGRDCAVRTARHACAAMRARFRNAADAAARARAAHSHAGLRTAACACSAASSSPSCVLPAIQAGRSLPHCSRSATARPRSIAAGISRSYLTLPVTCTRPARRRWRETAPHPPASAHRSSHVVRERVA